MNSLELLEKVHSSCTEHASKLIFNKKYQQHLYLVSLYGRIIELSHSCSILMKEKVISGVPVLLRTVLEAFADFKCLSEDDKYVNFMSASHIKEWLRVLEEAKKNTNPYLGKIAKESSLEEMYEHHKTEMEELRKNGYNSLNHYERFDKAGMEQEYRSMYNSLCSHSHNNIRALYDRHTQITGNDFTVVFYKEPEDHDIDVYAITLCDLLISASLIVHKFFDSDLLKEIESLSAEWEEIKKKKLENRNV